MSTYKILLATYITIIALALCGWAFNVIAVAHSDFSKITGLLVVRVIGVLVPPLGAVLGWFA